MTTEKKRIKVSLSEEAVNQLEWLIEQKRKQLNKRAYPCDVLEQLIKNEFTIQKVFKH